MLIIFVVVLELALLLLYLSLSHYYFLIFVGLVYIVFWYNSGAEQNGYEAKNTLRNYAIWRSFLTSVKYVWSNRAEFTYKRKLLFILTSNVTNMSLISGFGLHGGAFSEIDVRYVLPSILLSIPLLREFLLWSGAVAAPGNRDVYGTILRLLETGKSVAYCPGYYNASSNTEIDIPIDVFEFARNNDIYLVPVLVNNERQRYYVTETPYLQSLGLRHLQYPITMMFFPRIFGAAPPPKIELIIGVPMNPSAQQDAQGFKTIFQGQIDGFLGS